MAVEEETGLDLEIPTLEKMAHQILAVAVAVAEELEDRNHMVDLVVQV